jgi:acyl-coenzyme A thioesterase PaaI-like protein
MTDAVRRFLAAPEAPMTIDDDPLARSLGATLHRLDVARGVVEVGFEASPASAAANGQLPMGTLGTMLDFAGTCLADGLLPAGQSAVTVTLNVQTMRPSPPGPYRVRAELERKGRSMVYVRSTLQAAAAPEAIVASASSVLMIAGG